MIDRKTLLSDLQKLVKFLKKDLLERCSEEPEIDAELKAEQKKTTEAKRTAFPNEI